MRIVMLGTGHATVTKCYNTCYAYEEDGRSFLVDAGGGNGILSQLEKAGLELADMEGMFITHAHTDHVLGAVWIIRMVAASMHRGQRSRPFTVYANGKVMRVLGTIADMCLPAPYLKQFGEPLRFVTLQHGDEFDVLSMRWTAFDIESEKEPQMGYRAVLANETVIGCTGDEPVHAVNGPYLTGVDWLLTEAFCLSEDEETFHPHAKNHSTVKEAAASAQRLGCKRVLLYHTEDATLPTRRQAYTAEARTAYDGEIFVPDDLETIEV